MFNPIKERISDVTSLNSVKLFLILDQLLPFTRRDFIYTRTRIKRRKETIQTHFDIEIILSWNYNRLCIIIIITTNNRTKDSSFTIQVSTKTKFLILITKRNIFSMTMTKNLLLYVNTNFKRIKMNPTWTPFFF